MPQYYDPNTGKAVAIPQAPGTGKQYYDPDTGKAVATPSAIPADKGEVLPPADDRNGFQRGMDKLSAPTYAPPDETLLHHAMRGVANFGGGVIGGFTAPLVHPIQTAQSVGHLASAAMGNPSEMANDVAPMVQSFKEHPEEAIESGLGNIGGSALLAKGIGEVAPRVAGAGSALRTAAIGDTDAAALKGLRVPPSSKQSLRTLSAVEGSRPYLQGADSLKGVQSSLPAAKVETWSPYQQVIDSVGDTKVKGPDGPTTIRELEAEREQLSALNRGLRTGDPQAVQLATQKGMSQAELLQRENDIKAALDPRLEEAGIKPGEIRKAFGQLSTIDKLTMGRSTVAENPQPYGFGRMTNISLAKPKSWLGEPLRGARDIVAGRPLWSGKPTDINLGEAFRTGGPKPDFGTFNPNAKISTILQPFGYEPGGEAPSPIALPDLMGNPPMARSLRPATGYEPGNLEPQSISLSDIMRKPSPTRNAPRNLFLPKER